MTWDILIRGGTLYDGSSRPGERGDVAIADGRIAQIRRDLSGPAERVADALERALGEGHYQGSPNGSIDAAQIVLGAALENTARRHKVWTWRPGRPLLSAFLDEIARRPSFTATVQPEIEL